MKKILLAFGLLPIFSFAQMTSANEAAIGSTSNLYVCDSNTVTYSDVTGNGVTWDYRTLLGVQGLTKTLSVEAINPNSIDSLFVGATKKYSIGTLLTTYFSSDASSRVSQGNIFTEESLGTVVLNWNENSQILNNYPFALNDEVSDLFDGSIINENLFAPIDTVASGNTYSKIDGVGTLRLQQNDYTNVIRYNVRDTMNAVIFNALFGEVNIQLVRNWFEYYDYSTSNLPIFVVISITLNSELLNNSSTLVLSKDQPNANLSLADNSLGLFNIFPNPANEVLNIEAEGDFTVSVLNTKGEEVLKNSNAKTINVANFTSGIYFVKLQNEKGVQVKKFIKK